MQFTHSGGSSNPFFAFIITNKILIHNQRRESISPLPQYILHNSKARLHELASASTVLEFSTCVQQHPHELSVLENLDCVVQRHTPTTLIEIHDLIGVVIPQLATHAQADPCR